MEEAAIKIGIDGSGATKTLADLRRASQDLNTELEGAEVGSEAYKKLNQQLVSTNKEIKNLELGFEALDNEQQASELGSVAGAVGDVTTAFILLGGESDTMQQIAANVEKAMGVSMAFKGAIEGVSSARKLANSLDKESTIIKIKDAIVTKASAAGQWLLNAAMSANPIGLIVIGITALVAAFIAFKKPIMDVINSFKSLGDVLNFLISPFTSVLKWMGLIEDKEAKVENARKAQGKANRARHKERLAQIEKESKEYSKAKDEEIRALEMQIDTLDAEGKATEEIRLQVLEAERDKLKSVLESNRLKLESQRQLFEDIAKMNGKTAEQQAKAWGFDYNEVVEAFEKTLQDEEDALLKAENNITRFNREQLEKRASASQAASDKQKEIDDKAAEERKAALDKKAEEQLAADQRELKLKNDLLAQINKLENEYFDSLLTDQQREENAIREKYFNLIEQAEQYGEDATILKASQDAELLELEQQYRDASLEADKKLKDEKEALDKETFETRIAQQKELADKTIESANELISIVESINSIANDKEIARIKKKQEAGEKLTKKEIKRLENQQKIEKAIAIAKVATDTAKGISAAVAAGAGLPFPANIPAIISGVSAVLAGVAQASKIINAPAVDTSSVSQTSASGGLDTQGVSADAPNTDIFNTGSTLLNAPPTKVYVLEQDISDSQGNVAAIKQQATYG